jgi:thioredoxin 2
MNSIVACANCGAKNRIKTASSEGVPVCGRCGHSLPWLVDTTDMTFTQDVKAPVPVLVDFWAPWCGPCRMVGPVLEEIAREQAGRIKIVKLNVDENPTTAGQFRVQGIPMLVILKNGEPVDTVVGALPKGPLLQRLEPYLIA